METTGIALWLRRIAIASTIALSAGCPDASVGEGGVCRYDSKIYAADASFAASDGCNRCTCHGDGQVSCTEIACTSDGGAPRDGASPAPIEACQYAGQEHAEGDKFPSNDGCNTCWCRNGQIECTLIACNAVSPIIPACRYQGADHREGDRFPSNDGCNSCGCRNGRVECTTVDCGPMQGPPACKIDGVQYVEGDVVPPRDSCNTCWCRNGQIECTAAACLSCRDDHDEYDPGEIITITSDDCIKRCVCQPGTGELACTTSGFCAEPGDTCLHEGKSYPLGAQVPVAEGCTCSCNELTGLITCDAGCQAASFRSCKFGDTAFSHGNRELCPDGCNECLCNDGQWSSTDRACPPLQKLMPCDPATSVRADVPLRGYVVGDTLGVRMVDQDCGQPAPTVCFFPSFRESNPVQVTLGLNGLGDQDCTRPRERQFALDLTPLRDAYRAAYQQTTGVVALDLAPQDDVLYRF